MRLAAYQFDVRKGDVSHNLATVQAGLREAAEKGVQLVCLPEMWPSSFAPWIEVGESDAAVEAVRALSKELGLIVCGSAYAEVDPKEKPRNRMHVFADGVDVLAYDKTHLFSPTLERELFEAGEDPPVTAQTAIGSVSGVICYDLRFGPLIDVPIGERADILVVPAQWPSPRAAHWRALVVGRAVEGQMVVIAGNRTGLEPVGRGDRVLEYLGNSLIADSSGNLVAEGRGEAGLVVAELDMEEQRRLRRRVPVDRDRRPELYATWRKNLR